MSIVGYGWRRAWLIKAIVGSALAAGLAAALGSAIAFQGFGDFGDERRLIFAAMFLAFALLLAALAVTYLGELVRPRAVVRMEPDGLADRRISACPIAWSAIRRVLPVQNGMQLMLALDVADPARVPPPRNPVWRVNRWCARRLGYPELVVRVTGLDADLFTVAASIAACRGEA